MRVLIINTSERIGGAAIAAGRLMESLKNNGIKAKMLVHRYLERQPFPTVSSVRCRHCQHGNGHYLSSGISAGRRHSPALDQSGNAFIEKHPEDTYFRQTGRLDNA